MKTLEEHASNSPSHAPQITAPRAPLRSRKAPELLRRPLPILLEVA